MAHTFRRRSVRSVDARIARAAIPGFPLATREALREERVFGTTLTIRMTDDRLWEMFPNVLVIGERREHVSPDTVCAAAVLAAGATAALDGASALERHGVWDRHDGGIHVSSSRGRAGSRYRVPSAWRRDRAWRHRGRTIAIRYTRDATAASSASEMIRGVPTRRVIDAIFRAASSLSAHQLAFVIRNAEYARHLTVGELAMEAERRSGHRHVRVVREAIELRRRGSAGTKSRSEDRLLPLASACIGVPEVNVRGVAGVPTHEPDFCWPERRLIIEVDGDQHLDDPAQRASDLRNDALLHSAGWTVVRVHWTRVWNDWDGVEAELQNLARTTECSERRRTSTLTAVGGADRCRVH